MYSVLHEGGLEFIVGSVPSLSFPSSLCAAIALLLLFLFCLINLNASETFSAALDLMPGREISTLLLLVFWSMATCRHVNTGLSIQFCFVARVLHYRPASPLTPIQYTIFVTLHYPPHSGPRLWATIFLHFNPPVVKWVFLLVSSPSAHALDHAKVFAWSSAWAAGDETIFL